MTAPSLHIVADAHIWGAHSAFSALPGYDVSLRLLEHPQIDRQALAEADILLTRSSTRVGRELLGGTPVRFCATATIGDDHYDKQWLDEQGIVWSNAAGSSTASVVEYMLTVLLQLHDRRLVSIPDTTLGVVGVGRIGSALASRCSALGMKLLLNDPPLARSGESGFSALTTLLESADVITLHTPLVREGGERTQHLVDREFLQRFQGRGIINAARGACVDNDALLAWLDADRQRWAVLDCWEGEPLVSRRLLGHGQLVIATPHIAGHSLDGKAANTQLVYDALCRYLAVTPAWRAEAELPVAATLRFDGCQGDCWRDLLRLMVRLYPIGRDDRTMRSWSELEDAALARAFAEYRRRYPVRRGWERSRVELSAACRGLKEMAGISGIHLTETEL